LRPQVASDGAWQLPSTSQQPAGHVALLQLQVAVPPLPTQVTEPPEHAGCAPQRQTPPAHWLAVLGSHGAQAAPPVPQSV
jgi:hypothetical protein